MSQMMYYVNPIPLDKNAHKNFKLQRQDSYSYTDSSNSVPVAGFEFFEASRDFPIFFVKTKNDTFLPVAILSLRQEGHDLGPKWEDAYVPVYVRRYPFVLSSDGLVLFDDAAPHIQEAEGEPLFNDDGEISTLTKDLVKFLETCDQGYRSTEEYAKALSEKELLEPFKGELKIAESSVNLDSLYAVNEGKFKEALEGEELKQWFSRGWLAWTYAHLHSMNSFTAIIRRARTAHLAKQSTQAPGATEETSAS